MRSSPANSPSTDSPAPVAASLSDKLPHLNERYFFKHLAQDQLTIRTSPGYRPKVAAAGVGNCGRIVVTDPDSSFAMASYHANT